MEFQDGTLRGDSIKLDGSKRVLCVRKKTTLCEIDTEVQISQVLKIAIWWKTERKVEVPFGVFLLRRWPSIVKCSLYK